jgi:DNA invertase Pin-like site-specific DNA recombinase
MLEKTGVVTTYNACKPEVRASIIKLSVNGNGTRAISRCLGIHRDTVTAKKKKKKISSAM